MNEWDIAQVAAKLAPQWLYQRAYEQMIAEENRIAECIRMGVIGYDLTRDHSGSEGSSEGTEADPGSPGEDLPSA